MIHMKGAMLLAMNVFLVTIIHGGRATMMNSLLRRGGEKATLLYTQRDSLRHSRENTSGVSTNDATNFQNPTAKVHGKSLIKNGFQRSSGQQQPFSTGRKPRTIGSSPALPENLLLTTPELIRKHNYPVEEHFTVTPDGYILGLHRIPGPRLTPAGGRPKGGGRRVVLLMHGLFGTSYSFLANGPHYSLGFLLADAGYDVWLGNCRGNTYSRNHTSLNPDKQLQFWQFSQDEMASQDIPTMVRYVLQQTGEDDLYYVGYSQGTRLLYMAASAENSIMDKVHLFIAMASTGSREATGPRRIVSDIVSKTWRVPEAVGVGELLGRSASKSALLYWLCNAQSSLNSICSNLLVGYFSNSVPQDALVSRETIPLVLSSLLGGASMRQFAHFNQFSRGKFRKFDFGSFENRRLYGSPEPPLYDISAVTCPTALYWGQNDSLTPEEDVIKLAAALPNLVTNYKVPHPDFNHIDFIYSLRAKDLVYDHVISLMNQY